MLYGPQNQVSRKGYPEAQVAGNCDYLGCQNGPGELLIASIQQAWIKMPSESIVCCTHCNFARLRYAEE